MTPRASSAGGEARPYPGAGAQGSEGARSAGSEALSTQEPPSMAGKYCIVTGSNSGIGLQVARGLMRRGAHVVMACRNMGACQKAAAVLREEGLPGSCTCRAIDLEDLSSIRNFVKEQASELSDVEGGALAALREGSRRPARRRHVDVLVNNAGVMGVPAAADGSDRHLTANHLGPYLLTRLLLPHMTHGSRIVNVASRAHYAGSLSLVSEPRGSEAIRADTHHWWWQYARSKLCNVLFTAELQRRYGYGSRFGSVLQGAGGGGSGPSSGREDAAAGGTGDGGSGGTQPGGIGVHAVSPGLVDTGIFRHLLPGWAKWLRAPLRPFFRTPQQGAEVVLYAASSPELQGRDSLFLHDCREMLPSTAARDPRLAADLWRVSAVLVGLPYEDEAGGQ